MKWLLLWVLVGLAWQTAVVLYGRWRFGAQMYEVGQNSLTEGHFIWAFIFGVFTWPLGVVVVCIPASAFMRIEAFRKARDKMVEDVNADMKIRCPDCGEPYESETACDHPAE